MQLSGSPTSRRLALLVLVIGAVAALRLVFGPFSLQGLLFVAVTAVAAWRMGTRAGLLSAVLGLVAAHVMRFIAAPSSLLHPETFMNRQYFVSVGTYALLSAVVLLVGRRHWITLEQLDSSRRAREQADLTHREQLEAALARERAARLDAERANEVREQLLVRLSEELQRATDLAAIVEGSDDAILGTNLSKQIVSWNRAAEALFGYSAEEAIGRPIYDLIPPDRHDEERVVMEKIQKGETVVHFETVRRRRDGTTVPLSLTVSPIRNSAGAVVGTSKIARDITERRRAEEEIANLQTRLVALTAASGVLLRSPHVEDVVSAILAVARDLLPADAYAVWMREPGTGRWRIEASEGTSAAFGEAAVPARDISQMHEPLAVPDVTALAILEDRRLALDQEGIRSMLVVPVVTNGQTTSTAVFYYRAVHHFSEPELLAARAFGNLASAALTTAELYDRQQRTRMESEFLADAGVLLANSPDYRSTLTQVARLAVPFFADVCAIDLVDENGAVSALTVQHADPELAADAQELRRQYSPSSMAQSIRTGMPVLVEPPDETVVRGAGSGTGDRADRGAPRLGSIMIVPMVAREHGVGAITFALGEGRRRYSSDDLRFASSLASRAALAVDNATAYEQATRASRLKDEFLATLSHELRTPLNAILGYARMANSGILQGERLTRALDTLERNAATLTRLVEDVLDVSRFMTGKVQLKLQPIDLSTIVEQAVASLRPAAEVKGVRLTKLPAAEALPVHGDPDRLQQVTWNLVSNAVKFTPRGGAVEVSLGACDTQAELIVRDSGIGITSEFMPHVFERFRQGDGRFVREHGGLGLGLAIARDLVQLHGGTISASSAGPGQGTEFRVRLPLLAADSDDALGADGELRA